MQRLIDRGFVLLQRLLPKHIITRFVHWLARIRVVAIKNFLIRRFVRFFGVNTSDVAKAVPEDFADFNDFFIRDLAPGARLIDNAADALVSPVDGTVSASGTIRSDTIFQAKGLNYSLSELLATDLTDVETFSDGSFATIYLAPYNYHRVHSPLAGRLVAANYVPGDLYSVNAATVSLLPGLFVRNERLVCHFQTEIGKMILIMVGALNVGSISTLWSGEIRPRSSGVSSAIDLYDTTVSTSVRKGGLLGWFNMGSTVILLMPPETCSWQSNLTAGNTVLMGESIGALSAKTS
jgi:phosphatidylserine decarboxylase